MPVLPIDDDKYIHCPSLCHPITLSVVPWQEPEHLVISSRGCAALRQKCGGVVATELVSARAARPRSHSVRHSKERDGVSKVGASRGGDDVEDRIVRGGDAERYFIPAER